MTQKLWRRIEAVIITICDIGMLLCYNDIYNKVPFNLYYYVGMFLFLLTNIFDITIFKDQSKRIEVVEPLKKSNKKEDVLLIIPKVIFIVLFTFGLFVLKIKA